MNMNITDREDLFWAKMAGKDVDISTMTPPVAASVREELMLEVAERIGSGGGGGADLPTPGTVGNVLTDNGTKWVSAAPPKGALFATLEYDSDSGTYGLADDVSIADMVAALEAMTPVYIFVKSFGVFAPVWTLADDGGGICYAGGTMVMDQISAENYITVICDHGVWDVSQSTLPILPPTSSGNNGDMLGVRDGAYALVDNTAPFIVNLTLNNNTWTTDKTVGDILAAENAGRPIVCHAATDLEDNTSAFAFPRIEAFVMSSEPVEAPDHKYNMMVSFFDVDVQGYYVYRMFTADATTDYMTADE